MVEGMRSELYLTNVVSRAVEGQCSEINRLMINSITLEDSLEYQR